MKHPIESTFPIHEINRIAEMESTGFGRRHYRPVYVMHKWWARRLGSVFRALLLYSLADENLQDWDGNPKNLWNFYSRDVDFEGKIVLDPMMGGGTTVIESLRLGCKVIAGDINPVSWFIVKKQVEDIATEDLKNALEKIEEDIGNELRKYYRTRCPECGQDAEAIYYFFCKEITCSKCANIVPLMRNFFLAKSPDKRNDYVICPQCWNVFVTKNAKNESNCPKCDKKFSATRTAFAAGRRFHCFNETCRPDSVVKTIKNHGKLSERMYAIEFYCKHCAESGNKQLKNGRGYKAVDESDLELFNRACFEFQEIGDTLPIPDVAIPFGLETRRALNHDYKNFRDMFNARQLLNLGKIYRWILDIDDWNLKEFLILAFSNCLKYNNMFAKYNSTRGFITDIFRTHSFSPSLRPVEANCYDISKGRGAFTSFVRLVIEGKEYCQAPFDRVFVEKGLKKVNFQTKIIGKLASRFTGLQQDANVFFQCGSSERLRIPDRCVNVVVTDPPYYGNVMYSELSNFFYVWLRLGLREKYEWFEPELVPWVDEVVENRIHKKGREEYVEGLKRILFETNRVLVHDGLLVFTFHHKKLSAWGAILDAILASGFYVKAMHPVRSEMNASTHLYGVESISYDMVFVCKKKGTKTIEKTWKGLEKEVVSHVSRVLLDLKKNGEQPRTPNVLAIVLGSWLHLYSKYYPNVMTGNKYVTPERAIDLIEASLDEFVSELSLRSL